MDLPIRQMTIKEAYATHKLYETSDRDAPDCIKDSNGVVVLDLCKWCNRGEVELYEPCDRVPL